VGFTALPSLTGVKISALLLNFSLKNQEIWRLFWNW